MTMNAASQTRQFVELAGRLNHPRIEEYRGTLEGDDKLVQELVRGATCLTVTLRKPCIIKLARYLQGEAVGVGRPAYRPNCDVSHSFS